MVWYFTDNGPVSYYLYDRTAHQARLLFRDRPQLEQYKLAEMQPTIIPARDGFKLVSYLTLPWGIEAVFTDLYGNKYALVQESAQVVTDEAETAQLGVAKLAPDPALVRTNAGFA